jgi:heme/copper-type cytochrome/quinol oxidase subunit 2
MTPMRKLGPALVALILAALPVVAQESHPAHHQHEANAQLSQDQLEAIYKQITGREVPRLTVAPAVQTDAAHPVTNANKAFSIVAEQFEFHVTPEPFVVNVGDVVTLTITVPGNDGSQIGHGIFLPPFVPSINVARGQTVTRTFTVSGAPDTYPFVCAQSGCGLGHSAMFGEMRVNAAVANPAPTITSVSPTTIATNGGTTVSIFGTNFLSGATVKFDTLSATGVSFVSGTQLTAIAPAHPAGPVTVTVTNPDNQSATTTISYVAAGPSIASVSPQSGPNSGGTTLTINGSGFLGGARVTIGSREAVTSSVSDSQIVALTPLGPTNEELGVPQDVKVTNFDGTTATLPGAFTYQLAPLTISSISPNAGGNGTAVTLRGTGFTSTLSTVVMVGGVAATGVTVVDAGTIRFTAPAHANGTVDVVVTVGSNSVTSFGGFTYAPAPPRRRAVGRP